MHDHASKKKNSQLVNAESTKNKNTDMEIIDLAHLMENNMPAYPGDPSPVFEFKNTHKTDGYQVIRMSLITHTGTHLDTPAHFIANGDTLDKIPVKKFFGSGLLIDCSYIGQNEKITAKNIQPFASKLANIDFALIYTGWDTHWGTSIYYQDFPVLSEEAAGFLSEFQLKGIGLDVCSVDPVNSEKFPNHLLLLGKGLIIIENLTNLNHLTGKQFDFSAFPLKIKSGDGCPVRAVALIHD